MEVDFERDIKIDGFDVKIYPDEKYRKPKVW